MSADMNREFLQLMAKDVARHLPDNWGFIVMAAPFGPDGHLVYTSNIQRAAAINLLKEWLIKASGPEEWMKHIK